MVCLFKQHIHVQRYLTGYTGDVMYLNMLRRSVVVLNSVEAAIDLLEKRSANYSDRPPFPIFELCVCYFGRSSLIDVVIVWAGGRH